MGSSNRVCRCGMRARALICLQGVFVLTAALVQVCTNAFCNLRAVVQTHNCQHALARAAAMIARAGGAEQHQRQPTRPCREECTRHGHKQEGTTFLRVYAACARCSFWFRSLRSARFAHATPVDALRQSLRISSVAHVWALPSVPQTLDC